MLTRSASLAMSTSILKALPGKLVIKRHSPSILNLFLKLKHELMLHGQAEESGYYQCMAENEAGIDIATTYIRFKINGKFI